MNLKTAFRWVIAAQVMPVLAQALLAALARSGSQEALRTHMAFGRATLIIAAIQALAAVQCAHTRRVGVAGGKWRCADRLVCPAAGGCRRDRYSSGPRNIFALADFGVAITLEFIASPGPLRSIVPNVPSIGASACPADPGLRGAKLDPAARPVAAPADPTRDRLISFLSFDLDADNSRMEGWSNVR